MKHLILLLLISISSSIISFGQKNTDELIGDWKVINYETNLQINPDLIEEVRQISISRTFTFNSDKKFMIQYADTNLVDKGDYFISDDHKVFSMTCTSCEETFKEKYEIVLFEKGKMVWKQEFEGMGHQKFTLEKK